MSEDDDSFLSWIKVPEPEWQSVWDALHDAEIVSIEQNLLTRTVELTFRLGFPWSIEPRPETAHLLIIGVKRLLIYHRNNYIKVLPTEQLRIDNPEGSKVWQEWYELGHFRTASLGEFQALLNDGIDVLNPYVCEEHGFSLGLGGWGPTSDVNWYWLRIDGEQAEVSLDGTPSSMSELVVIGGRAWNAWSDRSA